MNVLRITRTPVKPKACSKIMSSVYFTSSIESPLCLFATFRSGDDMHVEFLDDGRRLRLLFVVDSNEI